MSKIQYRQHEAHMRSNNRLSLAALAALLCASSACSEVDYLKAPAPEPNAFFGIDVGYDGTTVAIGAPGGHYLGASNPALKGSVELFRDGASGIEHDRSLMAHAGDPLDRFGRRIAISGNVVAVTAQGEDSSAVGINGDETDNSAENTGAVYVFRDGQQEAFIKVDLEGYHCCFARAIALDADGDTLAASSDFSGVHIFRYDGATWLQHQVIPVDPLYIVPAIALDGDTLAFTAQDVQSPDPLQSVQIFTLRAGSWQYETEFSAYEGPPDWYGSYVFGTSLSLDAGSLVIGDPGAREVENNHRGYAYIYSKTATDNWYLEAKVTGENLKPGDDLGSSVSLDGNRLVVGAAQNRYGYPNPDLIDVDPGVALIFERTAPGVWEEMETLVAPNADARDRFGTSVSAKAGKVIVGAFLEDSANGIMSNNDLESAGAAYVFER